MVPTPPHVRPSGVGGVITFGSSRLRRHDLGHTTGMLAGRRRWLVGWLARLQFYILVSDIFGGVRTANSANIILVFPV